MYGHLKDLTHGVVFVLCTMLLYSGRPHERLEAVLTWLAVISQ